MTEKTIFHAGPPIDYPRMCGPMKKACICALLYEGLVKSEKEAIRLLERGEIQGMIGVGLLRIPMECFEQAVLSLRKQSNA